MTLMHPVRLTLVRIRPAIRKPTKDVRRKDLRFQQWYPLAVRKRLDYYNMRVLQNFMVSMIFELMTLPLKLSFNVNKILRQL